MGLRFLWVYCIFIGFLWYWTGFLDQVWNEVKPVSNNSPLSKSSVCLRSLHRPGINSGLSGVFVDDVYEFQN